MFTTNIQHLNSPLCEIGILNLSLSTRIDQKEQEMTKNKEMKTSGYRSHIATLVISIYSPQVALKASERIKDWLIGNG